MQIPATPQAVEDLDLMILLAKYAEGKATWHPDGRQLAEGELRSCRTLHANICEFVSRVLAPLLDRITSREMETFTLHDRVHGRKVAHLAWFILKPEIRTHLSPPEIGMLVLAAHLHDLGMGLSPEARQTRLAPESDLWERLEWDQSIKSGIEALRGRLAAPDLSGSMKVKVEQQLFQAEEALLCQDTRERHATVERYKELLKEIRGFHSVDPGNIPSVDACFCYDGQGFLNRLIDLCVSHNEDPESLVRRDEGNPAYPRFPGKFPVGGATADLRMVAAALRLADILDFDRERTPPALFHYLMPGPLAPEQDRAVLEWSKHLAISHWHIQESVITFRGRCTNHIVHHAIVQFCKAIEDEIEKTRLTLESEPEGSWPFSLPTAVEPEIYEEGYRYVPYSFELDDQRIYSLLMGGAIYDNPLAAVRELVQNAVDACKLRDAVLRLEESGMIPSAHGRIWVRYEEPTDACPQPKLIVRDTGTGMDEYILRSYFLKVGQSYYRSAEFGKQRIHFRKKSPEFDFAPVSEFGVGFLSCFLLADRVRVRTAMAEAPRGDTRKRTLVIDGPHSADPA